jgi:hypothetical protein
MALYLNVWVARIIEDHVFHERAQTKLTQLVEQEEVLCLSGQIIRELISVCTLGRNLSRPLTWDELRWEIFGITGLGDGGLEFNLSSVKKWRFPGCPKVRK